MFFKLGQSNESKMEEILSKNRRNMKKKLFSKLEKRNGGATLAEVSMVNSGRTFSTPAFNTVNRPEVL